MNSRKLDVTWTAGKRTAAALMAAAIGIVLLAIGPMPAAADEGYPLEVRVGQSVVVTTTAEVSTVSIADAKVADAAVGSERSVVVNGKSAGLTSLVVWAEGGRHTLYKVRVTDPNKSEQVELHVRVAELNTDRLKEFGVDWVGQYRNDKALEGTITGGLFVTKVETPFTTPIVGPTTDAFFTYRKTSGMASFLSTLRAMESKNAARTLASPTLVALSGDSAHFLAGGEFPVPIARSADATGITVTIQWKEFGVKLAFVPTVLDSNRIRLYVAPEVSAPDLSRSVLLAGYVVPGIVTRRVATTVEMGDGDVLVIGGVKHTEEIKTVKKFPILGEIPILNLLFKHKRTEKIDRDLLIAVSPQMIRTLARSFPSPMPGEEPANGKTSVAPKKR